MPSRSSLLTGLVLLACCSMGAAQTVIHAAGWIKPDGSLEQSPVFVSVNDGKIVSISSEPPTGTPVQAFPEGILAPGMIDLSGAVAALGERTEDRSPVEPHATAGDALNRFQHESSHLAHAGVTCFAISPSDDNLVGGQVAVARAVDGHGHPRLLTDGGPLHISLSPAVYRVDREPTSRTGALGMLRRELRKASKDDDSPLGQVASGKRMGLVTAPSAADVHAALRMAAMMDLKLALRHTNDGIDVADLVGAEKSHVVVGPLGDFSGQRSQQAAGAMSKAGARIALVGGYPGATANALRMTAAVAARGGLELDAARLGLSLVPAEVLGVSDKLGSIEKGKHADLVVFSGDPLDLRSKVLAVYVDGRRLEGMSHE